MSDQLRLWSKPELKRWTERHEQLRYWRKSLATAIESIYQFRHNRHTTGWSIGTQGFFFAILLWKAKAIDGRQLWRYGRIFRKANRLERRDFPLTANERAWRQRVRQHRGRWNRESINPVSES